jgi:hypothetical protein
MPQKHVGLLRYFHTFFAFGDLPTSHASASVIENGRFSNKKNEYYYE